MKYSIVVPVYNSEKTLNTHYDRVVKVMEDLDVAFEIIYVEDGGRDNSWRILCDLAGNDNRVIAIQLMHNSGQASATMCGLANSVGDYVITMDDDLQHPPEEIPALLDAVLQDAEADVIFAIPREKKHAAWRNVASQFVNLLATHVFKKSRSLRFSAFRIIRREVVDCIIGQNIPHPSVGALLMSVTPRIKNIYVRHDPRDHGKSGYTLAKMLTLTLSVFLAYSNFPLRFLAFSGIIGVMGSFLLLGFYLIRYVTGGIEMPGFTTIVLLVIGIAGFIFFSFGLVGEYLLRIMQSVHFTPQYIIRQKRNDHVKST